VFRETINGLEKVLDSDLPRGSVVLVTGVEGTLKSGLVFNILSGYLAGTEEHGLYASLEQSKESHLRNMESLGLRKAEGLHIFDYKDLRMEWRERELNMVEITLEVIESYRERYQELTAFALDSLNALYTLSVEQNLRRSMYYFFSELRDMGLTSFLITESPPLESPSGPERFLADGVIELGMVEGAEGVKRYIQIKKMRGAKHGMEKHQLIVGRDGLSVLGSIY
jgi:KaiC/GvpD/RAD55 family RecA-like ATPase